MSYLLLLPSNKLGKYTKIYLKKKTKKEENIKFTDDKNYRKFAVSIQLIYDSKELFSLSRFICF